MADVRLVPVSTPEGRESMSFAVYEELTAADRREVSGLVRAGYTVRYFRAEAGAVNGWPTATVGPVAWRELPGGDDPTLLNGCEAAALRLIEPVFSSSYRECRLVRIAVKLYGSDAIALCFKKEMLGRLERFLVMHRYLTGLARAFPRASIVGYGARHSRRFRVDRSLAATLTWPDTIRWEEPTGFGVTCATWFRQCRESVWWLLKLWSGAVTSAIVPAPARMQTAELGIRAYRTDLGVDPDRRRGIDFLLDGKRFTVQNTIFCWETEMPAQQQEQYRRRSYRTYNLLRETVKRIRLSTAWYGTGVLLAALLAPPEIANLGLHLVKTLARWENFLARYRIRNYLIYNDLGALHIARNVILERHGVATWFYTHSAHNINIFERAGQPLVHTHYALYYYRHFVTYAPFIADFYRRHENYIGEYHSIGCYWSAFIAGRASGAPPVITFFDTTWGLDDPYTGVGFIGAADYAALLRSILALGRVRTEWVIRFKEKNPPETWRTRQPELVALYQAVRGEPRLRFIPADADVCQIVAESDVVVSLAFTSTTIEALGAGRKAFWYDPRGRYRNTYYARVPNLVAHGPKELERLFDWWLALTPAALDEYLKTEIRPCVDPYADGRGLERFRELLTTASVEGSG